MASFLSGWREVGRLKCPESLINGFLFLEENFFLDLRFEDFKVLN